VAGIVGKRLEILGDLRSPEAVAQLVGRRRLARDLDAVDVEAIPDHLDLVARQADQPFDEILVGLPGRTKHDDVATLRRREEQTARHRRGREIQQARQRVVGIAVGVFGDEEVVADQQRRNQRSEGC